MVINKEIEIIIINNEEIKIQEEIRTIIGIIKIKIIIKEIEMIEMKEMIVMREVIEMTEMKEMKEMSKMIEMIEMKEMKDMIEIINKEETEKEDNIEIIKVSIVLKYRNNQIKIRIIKLIYRRINTYAYSQSKTSFNRRKSKRTI